MICVDQNRPCLKNDKWKYPTVCHLFSDKHDMEELHAFALRIGLKKEWFQDHVNLPHYDLTPAKRELAILKGATPVTDKQMVSYYKHPAKSKIAERSNKWQTKD